MKTVRGAITAENTEKDIAEKTRTLLTEIMKRNSLSVSDAEAIIFSTTADLTASYPAKAARLAGFSGTSLFSVLEPPIEGSLPKCIRVLVFLKEGKDAPKSVYLGGARILRPDLEAFMINIAIDGPSGAGKSTVARILAEKLGIRYLDTGAMYRAVALYMLNKGIDCSDAESVKKILAGAEVSVRTAGGEQRVFLNGEDVSEEIRKHVVSKAASDVSAVPEVRLAMVGLQRKAASEGDCVLDGRDIGTFVLPDAAIKIFLTAEAEERARRRHLELKDKGQEMPYEVVLEDIRTRDKNDSSRAFAPLKRAEDAILLDTTDMTAEEAAEFIAKKYYRLKRA